MLSSAHFRTPARWRALILAAACASPVFAQRSQPATKSARPLIPGAPAGVTAFVDVAVIPMDQERVLPNQTVVVQGGRIIALGPTSKVKIPRDANRIDGHGKYLMPGLADMHAHIRFVMGHGNIRPYSSAPDSAGAEKRLFQLLASGVTTIRNLDYNSVTIGEHALRLRSRAAAGTLLSPRIYTAGSWTGYEYGSSQSNTIYSGSGSLDSVIAAYKAKGYDFIKVHDEGTRVLESIASAAKSVGIPMIGHVPRGTTIEHALTLGYTSVEHTINDYQGHGGSFRGSDSTTIQALVDAMRDAKVWSCPTLAHYDRLHSNPKPPNFLAMLHKAGVPLLLGTDEIPWRGFITLELQSMIASGLTPYQALETGTSNVARYFNWHDEGGTVTLGNRADLVLLPGNPLTDIRYTAQPDGVMLGGRWIPRAEIEARLEEYAIGPRMTSYWFNAADLTAEAVNVLIAKLPLTGEQRTALQQSTAATVAHRKALVDSLGMSVQYAEDDRRLLRIFQQQLEAVIATSPPEKREAILSFARDWFMQRETTGYRPATQRLKPPA